MNYFKGDVTSLSTLRSDVETTETLEIRFSRVDNLYILPYPLNHTGSMNPHFVFSLLLIIFP